MTTHKRHQKLRLHNADQLRTVSLGNDSHPTGVVKLVNGPDPNPPTHHNSVIEGKIEKVPRGIRGEKSSKDMASSRNLVSTIGALASPKMGDGTRCPEG